MSKASRLFQPKVWEIVIRILILCIFVYELIKSIGLSPSSKRISLIIIWGLGVVMELALIVRSILSESRSWESLKTDKGRIKNIIKTRLIDFISFAVIIPLLMLLLGKPLTWHQFFILLAAAVIVFALFSFRDILGPGTPPDTEG